MFLGYKSRKEVEQAVEEIVRRSGLKKNFYVMECPQIDNCFATTKDGNRLIVYDGNFMNKVNDATKTDWAAWSILAHEIGHHLQGHTIDGEASDHRKELEADEFSGFVMYQLGAGLKDAQAAMRKFSDEYPTSTHPVRSKRLVSIEKGYKQAQSLYPNISKNPQIQENTEEPEPEIQEKPIEHKPQPKVIVQENPNIETPKTGCIEGNCQDGYGVAINKNSFERYEGQWKTGKRTGVGIEFYEDGNKKYEGNFLDGKWNGIGVYYLENGDRYIGKFKNNLMHDREAQYIFENGMRYKGGFLNGKRHGNAIIYSPDNTQEEAYFEHGERVK